MPADRRAGAEDRAFAGLARSGPELLAADGVAAGQLHIVAPSACVAHDCTGIRAVAADIKDVDGMIAKPRHQRVVVLPARRGGGIKRLDPPKLAQAPARLRG